MSSKPVIAVPACRRFMGIHPFHMVGEKYITALKDATEGLPWMIPAINDDGILDAVLAKVDGLFLTGSYSDIEPHKTTLEFCARLSRQAERISPPTLSK